MHGSIKSVGARLLRRIDMSHSCLSARRGTDRDHLVSLMFHGISAGERVLGGYGDDQLVNTIDEFAEAIEYFHSQGFQFLRCADLLADLPRNGRFVHLSFDDGYANNLAVLPVLEQFQVPATFFIATGHIESGDAFWWDAVYHVGLEQGHGRRQIDRLQLEIKKQSPRAFHRSLETLFGDGPIRPQGDHDRPMTIDELKQLAAHPLVEIGNHSHNHYALPHCTPEVAVQQITDAQEWLVDVLGQPAKAFAYPYGYWDEASIQAVAAAGIQLAFGTHDGRARIPIQGHHQRSIGRYELKTGNPINGQCRMMRSPWSVFDFAHKVLINKH